MRSPSTMTSYFGTGLSACRCIFGRVGSSERGLRGREAREWDAVRRARHVVQAELVAERDALRLASVLAADAELELGLRAAAALDRDPHQVADAADVERLERVLLEHAVLEIRREELPLGVVTREAKRRLREIVRPEGEEIGLLGDLVRADACARELDHRPAQVVDVRRLLVRDANGELAQPPQLLLEPDERMHDLDERRLTRPLVDRTRRAD